jgi:hypothetical protein
MRSCGRARKREGLEKLLGMRGGDEEVASTIGVLLSKNSTASGNVMVNGREHSEGANVCQYNISPVAVRSYV